MFSRPKILFLVSLLFVALLNPKLNPYLLFKFLIFYHSSSYSIHIIRRMYEALLILETIHVAIAIQLLAVCMILL